MRADGVLAMLDRWGRLLLPGTILLFFVLMTLAPLRVPYIADSLPLLPALAVFQFSLATPERLVALGRTATKNESTVFSLTKDGKTEWIHAEEGVVAASAWLPNGNLVLSGHDEPSACAISGSISIGSQGRGQIAAKVLLFAADR